MRWTFVVETPSVSTRRFPLESCQKCLDAAGHAHKSCTKTTRTLFSPASYTLSLRKGPFSYDRSPEVSTDLQMTWPANAISSSGLASGIWKRLCLEYIWWARWIFKRSNGVSSGPRILQAPAEHTGDGDDGRKVRRIVDYAEM